MIMLVKYRESFIINSAIHSWKWVKVVPTVVKKVLVTRYKTISEEEADRIKDELGLVCVEKDKTMQLWDTPKRDFQKKYKKRIEVSDLQWQR